MDERTRRALSQLAKRIEALEARLSAPEAPEGRVRLPWNAQAGCDQCSGRGVYFGRLCDCVEPDSE
jgi:hypothetical protein